MSDGFIGTVRASGKKHDEVRERKTSFITPLQPIHTFICFIFIMCRFLEPTWPDISTTGLISVLMIQFISRTCRQLYTSPTQDCLSQHDFPTALRLPPAGVWPWRMTWKCLYTCDGENMWFCMYEWVCACVCWDLKQILTILANVQIDRLLENRC